MTNFFAEPTTITLRDKTVSVSPLAVKNLSKAAKLATPIIGIFGQTGFSPITVLENADTVIALTALASGESEDWVGELNGAELLALLQIVITVNSDFFIQTITPTLTELMQSVKKSVTENPSIGTQP